MLKNYAFFKQFFTFVCFCSLAFNILFFRRFSKNSFDLKTILKNCVCLGTFVLLTLTFLWNMKIFLYSMTREIGYKHTLTHNALVKCFLMVQIFPKLVENFTKYGQKISEKYIALMANNSKNRPCRKCFFFYIFVLKCNILYYTQIWNKSVDLW